MSATTSSDAVTRQLARRRGEGRRALVVYLTAGYPTPSQSAQLLRDVAAAGADIVEVGVPFSDPMADGPVIQLASQVALGHGVGLRGTLEIVRQAALPVPVVLFSYLNPLLAGGPGILEQATEAGVAGVLVTDLPVGVDPERERWLGESGLAFIRLVAPTTPDDRMREIGRHGSGFVYLISRLGVTGMQSDLSPELAPTIRRLRAATTLPLCAGFGISTPEQARAAGALADGIVVGSAIVSAAGRAPSEAVALTARLREALDSL